jgi:hypothetical protein
MTKPITWQIQEYAMEMNSSYNDGWTCMHYMQKLFEIKWAVDKALSVYPEIVGMDKWIEENMPEWNKKQLQEA